METSLRLCHSCAGAIPAAEFKKHRAVIIMKRDYCGACADRITRRKSPIQSLTLPGLREHPFVAVVVLLSLVLAAILFGLLAVHPPA